jgi:hypothetical protein
MFSLIRQHVCLCLAYEWQYNQQVHVPTFKKMMALVNTLFEKKSRPDDPLLELIFQGTRVQVTVSKRSIFEQR